MPLPLHKAMRQCYRKSSFESAKTARKKINIIIKEGGPQMYVYTCMECGRYHLTKNKDVPTVL